MVIREHNSELLAKTIQERIGESGRSQSSIASSLLEYLGYKSIDTAFNYLFMLKLGRIYGTTSGKPQNPTLCLERLSKLLYAFEIDDSDPLVTELRKSTPDFRYPPDGFPEPNVLIRTTTIERKISRLKKEDYNLIEQLVDRLLTKYE